MKKQAIENLQVLLNNAVKQGMFNNAATVLAVQESINYLSTLQELPAQAKLPLLNEGK